MFDLHTHSVFSDGTLPPEKLIEKAQESGLSLVALTDHDTVRGVPLARAAAERLYQPFLCGVELEAEYPEQLHILGIGVDPDSTALRNLIAVQDYKRNERNARILKLLFDDGMRVYDQLAHAPGTVTRANIAAALVKEGFAESVGDAFRRYIGRGKKYYVPMEHASPREVLDAISSAGGVSVLAHPMNMKCDHAALIRELADNGLWGVEAYYGSASEDTTEYFRSLAEGFGLHPTCGSDFHGANRPHIELGCSWRETDELNETERLLMERFGITRDAPTGRDLNVRGRRPGRIAIGEYQAIASRVISELPEDLFIGLNGGVVISENSKLHSKSVPGRPLYILGEYHHGGGEGCYILLYYGSFARVYGRLHGSEAEEKIRSIILHEFRHHLEIRAGEHDLEYEDDDRIAEYVASVEEDAGFGSER